MKNKKQLFTYIVNQLNSYDGRTFQELIGMYLKDIYQLDEFMRRTLDIQNKIKRFCSLTGHTDLDVGMSDGIAGPKTIKCGCDFLNIKAKSNMIIIDDNKFSIVSDFISYINLNNNIGFMDSLIKNSILFANYKTLPDYDLNRNAVGKSLRIRKDLNSITEVTIHETCDNNAQSTIRTLRNAGYSTHFIIDAVNNTPNIRDFNDIDIGTYNAIIYQCAPINAMAVHIGKRNGYNIGIDIVNPYYPNIARNGKFKINRIINNKFIHKGKYITPFDIQIKALYKLLEVLIKSGLIGFNIMNCKEYHKGIGFQFGIHVDIQKDNGVPGFISHCSVGSHMDGQMITYQLFRLMNGMNINWDILDKGQDAPNFLLI